MNIDVVDWQIWRHLLFYANETVQSSDTVRPDNLSLSLGSFTASQKDNARSVVGTTRSLERVAALLRGTLDRLQEVELVRLELKFHAHP